MGVFPLPDLHISTIADIHALEQTAVTDLALPNSTYELLQNAAATYGDKVALRFLPKATLDEQSINLSFRQLFAGVTQTANALHQLGVDKHSVVSMLLPNLPQTHL
ncbi:MAG TPA: acyl-CoA synthetase, partial [Pseudomonas sp.]|nr:acyl-CoA synthetase [Pseudomonas sp.]